jgi:hypothetical protein
MVVEIFFDFEPHRGQFSCVLFPVSEALWFSLVQQSITLPLRCGKTGDELRTDQKDQCQPGGNP